jgi:glycosyltransferase involved in cell wall biosynthesis
MKLLVFAHTPPPHHGQSYMVQLMLEGFGGDRRKGPKPEPSSIGNSANRAFGVECYQVNARLSKKLEDIGDFRVGKFFLLLGYCAEAIWCRYRYGVKNLYYIPSPGKPSALYRDWLVMMLCRPFFKRVILHWHAAGLAKWLETVRLIRARTMTFRVLRHVDTSIVLSNYNRADAEKLWPKQIKIVGNGIPDPCPRFEQDMLPRRKARLAARRKLWAGQSLGADERAATGGDPQLFRVLYLAHCMRQKGLFDTLEAVALTNQKLSAMASPLRLHLTVAGEFISGAEQNEFEQRIAQPDLQLPPTHQPTDNTGLQTGQSVPAVEYKGFVSGDRKSEVLAASDCFCFPTYYYAESFGLVVVEAMAFGLQVVCTRWRSLPELLPPDYPGLVEVRAPEQIATAFLGLFELDMAEDLRALFLRRFTLDRFLANLAEAIHSTEQAALRFTLDMIPGRPPPKLA